MNDVDHVCEICRAAFTETEPVITEMQSVSQEKTNTVEVRPAFFHLQHYPFGSSAYKPLGRPATLWEALRRAEDR